MPIVPQNAATTPAKNRLKQPSDWQTPSNYRHFLDNLYKIQFSDCSALPETRLQSLPHTYSPLRASAFFRNSRNPGPGKLSISRRVLGWIWRVRLFTYKQITKKSYVLYLYLLMGKKDNGGHGYCHDNHSGGQQKTEDAGVGERHSEREGTRKYTQPNYTPSIHLLYVHTTSSQFYGWNQSFTGGDWTMRISFFPNVELEVCYRDSTVNKAN